MPKEQSPGKPAAAAMVASAHRVSAASKATASILVRTQRMVAIEGTPRRCSPRLGGGPASGMPIKNKSVVAA